MSVRAMPALGTAAAPPMKAVRTMPVTRQVLRVRVRLQPRPRRKSPTSPPHQEPTMEQIGGIAPKTPSLSRSKPRSSTR